MKPIIGLLAEVDDDKKTILQYFYTHAIEKFGGLPILLPYTENQTTMQEWITLCDGFIFTGGADVDPSYYGQTLQTDVGHIQKHRDAFEFAMFKKIYATEKPILGICRGMQLINVALGGTLCQDIPSMLQTQIIHRQPEGQLVPAHKVLIQPNTPLSRLTGKAYMQANSFHHQAVDCLADTLVPMAYAEDDVLEAYYAPEKPFLRAYQWHPERLCNSDADNALIFFEFVQACQAEK